MTDFCMKSGFAPANYDYHKAFLVARILSSERLRSREK